MNNQYPKSCVVWRGAILGGIAHAVMAAEDANCGFARSWINQDYLVQNEQGLYGTISLEGPLLLATFFDSKSMRSPYHDQRFNFNRFFEGCFSCYRCLLKTRRNLAPELHDKGVRCVTAAFWNDGESLAAADGWDLVLKEGARLVRTELIHELMKHWPHGKLSWT